MRTVLPLAIIILLAACRKNKPEFDGVHCSGNCYILTGTVRDTPSYAGLQGVELKFYYRPPGMALFMDPTRYLGKAISNEAGEFRFQFDGTNYKSGEGYFFMKATRNGYFYDPFGDNTVTNFNLDSSQFNMAVAYDFVLFRPAKLTVRFRAVTITNFQFLTFSYGYGIVETGIILHGGRNMDTTISFNTAGDVHTSVRWSAKGNGVDVQKRDTLFAARGGTVYYQIDL